MAVSFTAQETIILVLFIGIQHTAQDFVDRLRTSNENPSEVNRFLENVLEHKDDFHWIRQVASHEKDVTSQRPPLQEFIDKSLEIVPKFHKANVARHYSVNHSKKKKLEENYNHAFRAKTKRVTESENEDDEAIDPLPRRQVQRPYRDTWNNVRKKLHRNFLRQPIPSSFDHWAQNPSRLRLTFSSTHSLANSGPSFRRILENGRYGGLEKFGRLARVPNVIVHPRSETGINKVPGLKYELLRKKNDEDGVKREKRSEDETGEASRVQSSSAFFGGRHAKDKKHSSPTTEGSLLGLEYDEVNHPPDNLDNKERRRNGVIKSEGGKATAKLNKPKRSMKIDIIDDDNLVQEVSRDNMTHSLVLTLKNELEGAKKGRSDKEGIRKYKKVRFKTTSRDAVSALRYSSSTPSYSMENLYTFKTKPTAIPLERSSTMANTMASTRGVDIKSLENKFTEYEFSKLFQVMARSSMAPMTSTLRTTEQDSMPLASFDPMVSQIIKDLLKAQDAFEDFGVPKKRTDNVNMEVVADAEEDTTEPVNKVTTLYDVNHPTSALEQLYLSSADTQATNNAPYPTTPILLPSDDFFGLNQYDETLQEKIPLSDEELQPSFIYKPYDNSRFRNPYTKDAPGRFSRRNYYLDADNDADYGPGVLRRPNVNRFKSPNPHLVRNEVNVLDDEDDFYDDPYLYDVGRQDIGGYNNLKHLQQRVPNEPQKFQSTNFEHAEGGSRRSYNSRRLNSADYEEVDRENDVLVKRSEGDEEEDGDPYIGKKLQYNIKKKVKDKLNENVAKVKTDEFNSTPIENKESADKILDNLQVDTRGLNEKRSKAENVTMFQKHFFPEYFTNMEYDNLDDDYEPTMNLDGFGDYTDFFAKRNQMKRRSLNDDYDSINDLDFENSQNEGLVPDFYDDVEVQSNADYDEYDTDISQPRARRYLPNSKDFDVYDNNVDYEAEESNRRRRGLPDFFGMGNEKDYKDDDVYASDLSGKRFQNSATVKGPSEHKIEKKFNKETETVKEHSSTSMISSVTPTSHSSSQQTRSAETKASSTTGRPVRHIRTNDFDTDFGGLNLKKNNFVVTFRDSIFDLSTMRSDIRFQQDELSPQYGGQYLFNGLDFNFPTSPTFKITPPYGQTTLPEEEAEEGVETLETQMPFTKITSEIKFRKAKPKMVTDSKAKHDIRFFRDDALKSLLKVVDVAPFSHHPSRKLPEHNKACTMSKQNGLYPKQVVARFKLDAPHEESNNDLLGVKFNMNDPEKLSGTESSKEIYVKKKVISRDETSGYGKSTQRSADSFGYARLDNSNEFLGDIQPIKYADTRRNTRFRRQSSEDNDDYSGDYTNRLVKPRNGRRAKYPYSRKFSRRARRWDFGRKRQNDETANKDQTTHKPPKPANACKHGGRWWEPEPVNNYTKTCLLKGVHGLNPSIGMKETNGKGAYEMLTKPEQMGEGEEAPECGKLNEAISGKLASKLVHEISRAASKNKLSGAIGQCHSHKSDMKAVEKFRKKELEKNIRITEDMLHQVMIDMNKVIMLQVHHRTCQRIAPELQLFLKQIVKPQEKNKRSKDDEDMGENYALPQFSPKESCNVQADTKQGDYLFKMSTKLEERKELRKKMQIIQSLLRQYDNMSEKCQIMVMPVRMYLEKNLNTLQALLKTRDKPAYQARAIDARQLDEAVDAAAVAAAAAASIVANAPQVARKRKIIAHSPKLSHRAPPKSEAEKAKQQLIDEQLEKIGLGSKHSHKQNSMFNVDKILQERLGRSTTTESDIEKPQTSIDYFNARAKKRDAEEAAVWDGSEKYRRLVEAAEDLRKKREAEERLGQLFGRKENKAKAKAGDDVKGVTFEAPLILTLE